MGGVIGPAADFFRLRVTRIDDTEEPDLEWRDDILYRTPPRDDFEECESYALEAVDLADDEVVCVIAHFGSRDEACAALERISEDLDEMTRSGFESRYLSGD